MQLDKLLKALAAVTISCLVVPSLEAAGGSWTEYANIQYGELSKGNKDASTNLVSLDVYVPDDLAPGEKLPLVVMFHGGAAGTGDKAHPSVVENKIPFFTSNGFVFASANYELSPGAKYPVNIQDVADAITFLYDNAADYQIDPEKINVMGHSTGAHFVALVATNGAFFKKAGASVGIVKKLIVLDGIYDLPYRIRTDTEDDNTLNKEAIHTIFGRNPILLYAASPSLILKKAPRTYTHPILNFFTGTEVKIASDVKFIESLLKNNIPAGGIECRGFTHADVNWYVGLEGSEMNQPILDFLAGADPKTLDGEIEKTPGPPVP